MGCPLKLIWLYKVILKNRQSIYNIKRFVNTYLNCAGPNASFGGSYFINKNVINWTERIKCKDMLELVGDYTFKETLKAMKDYIFCSPIFDLFKVDL